jgi:hypothetical protein
MLGSMSTSEDWMYFFDFDTVWYCQLTQMISTLMEMKMEMAMVKRREDEGSTGQASCRRLNQGLGLYMRLLPGVEQATATAATWPALVPCRHHQVKLNSLSIQNHSTRRILRSPIGFSVLQPFLN